MQQQQFTAALARRLRRLSTLATALGASVLLSACVSGTSGDTACANNSLASPLTGKIAGNVVVPRDATCYLKANVAGDVNAKDGAKVYVLDGTRIGGSFRAVGAQLVRFNLDESAINLSNRPDGTAGKVVVGSNLIIKESRLAGESGIAATEIGGNLVIARNESAATAPASVKVCTPGICKAKELVKVGKSVKIKQNHIEVAINNTSIGADLKCSSNQQAPVVLKAAAIGGQVAVKGRRSGQCEQLREVVMAPAAAPVAVLTPKAVQ
jgi:hypothetical protein